MESIVVILSEVEGWICSKYGSDGVYPESVEGLNPTVAVYQSVDYSIDIT